MTTTPRYFCLDTAALSRGHQTLDAAKAEARDLCAKIADDVSIVEIFPVGTYEHVSPIWTEDKIK